MLRTALPWLMLLALGLIALSFLDQPATRLLTPTGKATIDYPYAFMENIETLEYDTQGQLRYRMSTPVGRYFQQDPNRAGPEDYTLIDQPRLVFYPANSASPWHLRAKYGYSRANGQDVKLSEEVVAEQQSDHQGLIQVSTEALHINTSEQYAETDKAVKMRAQLGQLETLGMRAYLSEDRIELLSQVRGVYAP